MANYKEITGSGSSWTRAYRVTIENPIKPSVINPLKMIFLEEEVVKLDEKIVTNHSGSVTLFYDPQGGIELLDIETGEKTGALISQQYVYTILYSLYMHGAYLRDNELPPPAPSIPVESDPQPE